MVVPRRNLPRRNAPGEQPKGAGAARPLPASFGWTRTEQGKDGDWIVRQQPGNQASKTYRCPGCEQEIRPGTPHLVAWPADEGGAEQRRHWHTGCWSARHHRGPTSRRW